MIENILKNFKNYLLTETKQTVILEGRLEDEKTKYPNLSSEIDQLSKNDPSDNLKYLSWSAKQLNKGEKLEDLISAVNKFHKNLLKIEKKDINQYKSLEDLSSLLNKISDVSSTQKKKQEKEDALKLDLSKDVLVVVPLTMWAAAKYSANTKLCVSSLNYAVPFFDGYFAEPSKGVVVIVINKSKNKKLAFLLPFTNKPSEEQITYADYRDEIDGRMSIEKFTSEADITKNDLVKIVDFLKENKEIIQDAKKTKNLTALFKKKFLAYKEKYKDKVTLKKSPLEIHFKNEKGQLHREDGPAVETISGNMSWYTNGKLIKTKKSDNPCKEVYADSIQESLKKIIKEELAKVLEEEWSDSEREKRKSKCSNPKGFTMKQFCKNQRTRSKQGEKTNERLNKTDPGHTFKGQSHFYSNDQEEEMEEGRKLGKPSSESNLGDWFKRKGAPGKKGGWVDCNTCHDGKCKPCGRQEGEKRSKYPRCRPTPSQCKGYKRRHSNLQREEDE